MLPGDCAKRKVWNSAGVIKRLLFVEIESNYKDQKYGMQVFSFNKFFTPLKRFGFIVTECGLVIACDDIDWDGVCIWLWIEMCIIQKKNDISHTLIAIGTGLARFSLFVTSFSVWWEVAGWRNCFSSSVTLNAGFPDIPNVFFNSSPRSSGFIVACVVESCVENNRNNTAGIAVDGSLLFVSCLRF